MRKRDSARVIDAKEHDFKLSCVDVSRPPRDEDVVYVKWNEDEIEKQYRLKCRKCNLWCFYKHSMSSDVIFIVKKSMNIRPRNPLLAARTLSGVQRRPGPSARHESGLNRFASVAISSLEEEEAEAEAKEIANSYEINATIVRRELERQQELRKRRRDDDL